MSETSMPKTSAKLSTQSSQALPRVTETSRIAISFELALMDGEVIEKATSDEPMIFTIGEGALLPKIESLLIGLELGTQGKFTLSPEAAFGHKSDENIQKMPRESFPEEMTIETGLVIGFDTPTGEEVPGVILSVREQEVEVDFNHPLAGATLSFTAKIEQIFDDSLGDS